MVGFAVHVWGLEALFIGMGYKTRIGSNYKTRVRYKYM